MQSRSSFSERDYICVLVFNYLEFDILYAFAAAEPGVRGECRGGYTFEALVRVSVSATMRVYSVLRPEHYVTSILPCEQDKNRFQIHLAIFKFSNL